MFSFALKSVRHLGCWKSRPCDQGGTCDMAMGNGRQIVLTDPLLHVCCISCMKSGLLLLLFLLLLKSTIRPIKNCGQTKV